VADLKTEIAAARKARAAIGETAIAEKRSMTDDERAKFAEAKAKIDGLEAQLADADEILASAEQANEAERQAIARHDPDSQAAAAAEARAGVVAVRDNAQDDPKRGFKDHRDFLKAVMVAGRGGRVDARLASLQAAAGSDEQGEYSGPHGGFLVPSGVAPGILSIAPQDDVLTPLFTDVPMTTPTLALNARVDKDHTTSVSGGFIVTRRPETVAGSGSRQKYDQVVMTANEEYGLAFATQRILTDSPQSFVAIIQAGFRDEFVANAMKEYISGTGVGERQGAMNAGCKVSIAKESGQTAATIVKANIDNMASRCWRYSRAVWLANQNTRAQLKSLVQVVGTGGNSVPYFVTDGAPAGFDGVLDGRPLVFTEFAETLGTEGDLILIVPSEYLVATYQSEQFAESMHVRFVEAESAFRFYRRNDGQWWWKTAMTPKKGSTLSPVVTLATRG
jgi:HK97 family phage major capsid protein